MQPKNLCALIGANSAGKSNILKAIDLVLGEGWATKAKVAKELFYDLSQPIEIHISLLESIPWQYYGRNVQVNKITLHMTYAPLSCEVRLWSNHPSDNSGKGYYLNDEFKKSCHFIYVPSIRRLEAQMYVSNWTLLGKLMRTIYEEYVRHYDNDEDRLKSEFKTIMQPPKEFLEADFDQNKITFARFSSVFIRHCQANSAGLADGFMPNLNIYNPNWFYKTLQICIQEDSSDKVFDAEEVGSGMQNLILLSIFQTYAELVGGRAILAIEEPELFLYPQAQRHLYKSFRELTKNSVDDSTGEISRKGTQIFYTTHNPNFVDAQRADEIELIAKNRETGTHILEKSELITSEFLKQAQFATYTHFNTERNELFFAKKILLVEGASDKILFATLCKEKWGIDTDKTGISIIECGGKLGVLFFIGVCRLSGIEKFFAVWDSDNDSSEEVRDEHSQFQYTTENGRGLQIAGTLEQFLQTKFPASLFRAKYKVKDAYDWACTVVVEEIPIEFDGVRNFLGSEAASTPEEETQVEEVVTTVAYSSDIRIEDLPF